MVRQGQQLAQMFKRHTSGEDVAALAVELRKVLVASGANVPTAVMAMIGLLVEVSNTSPDFRASLLACHAMLDELANIVAREAGLGQSRH